MIKNDKQHRNCAQRVDLIDVFQLGVAFRSVRIALVDKDPPKKNAVIPNDGATIYCPTGLSIASGSKQLGVNCH